MGLKSFFKKLFGLSDSNENTTFSELPKKEQVISEPVKAETAEKTETVKVDVEKATEILENRLKEISSEKKVQEKKVTAKEIKAKVKTEKVEKPVAKKPVDKISKAKPTKKTESKSKVSTSKTKGN